MSPSPQSSAVAPLLARLSGAAELLPTFAPRPQISHIVFDFDGTLSWLRHGWPQLMLGVFRRYFPANARPVQDIEALLLEVVLGMNGRPTILQMIRFSELVQEAGGPKLDPEALRAEYQGELDQEIARRSAMVQSGVAAADDFVVFGGRAFLEKLRESGIKLAILSSTVEERVKEEAALLGLTHFFGSHIYGGVGNPAEFSKMAVFRRLLESEEITGENLLSFGDGPVEIANTKELGGVAIAVCSDEENNGSGTMDPFKKAQLLKAGADAAIPDFRDAPLILDFLLGR